MKNKEEIQDKIKKLKLKKEGYILAINGAKEESKEGLFTDLSRIESMLIVLQWVIE